MKQLRIEWERKKGLIHFRILKLDGVKSAKVKRQKWKTVAHGMSGDLSFFKNMVGMHIDD